MLTPSRPTPPAPGEKLPHRIAGINVGERIGVERYLSESPSFSFQPNAIRDALRRFRQDTLDKLKPFPPGAKPGLLEELRRDFARIIGYQGPSTASFDGIETNISLGFFTNSWTLALHVFYPVDCFTIFGHHFYYNYTRLFDLHGVPVHDEHGNLTGFEWERVDPDSWGINTPNPIGQTIDRLLELRILESYFGTSFLPGTHRVRPSWQIEEETLRAAGLPPLPIYVVGPASVFGVGGFLQPSLPSEGGPAIVDDSVLEPTRVAGEGEAAPTLTDDELAAFLARSAEEESAGGDPSTTGAADPVNGGAAFVRVPPPRVGR